MSSVLERGYHVAYRPHEVNHCPGCGRSHWYVGRLSAECGFCGTAMPIADSSFAVTIWARRGDGPWRVGRRVTA